MEALTNRTISILSIKNLTNVINRTFHYLSLYIVLGMLSRGDVSGSSQSVLTLKKYIVISTFPLLFEEVKRNHDSIYKGLQ